MKLQNKEIQILERIIDKFSREKQITRKRILLMDYKEFLFSLDKEEKRLIKRIQGLDLKKYNKKTPFLGILPVPKNLVMIRGQKYKINSKVYQVPLQFLSREVYWTFKKMNQAIKNDLKKPLLIMSGYRSPAFQMIIFLNYLKEDNWKIKKTLKRVALPGYSEHSYPLKQGVDFGAVKQTVNPQDFAKTSEYGWLKRNAAKFRFYLSYPRSNKLGMMFEPWHWHYE
jgi:D-alanyl-D-alanine carboxypeptidase